MTCMECLKPVVGGAQHVKAMLNFPSMLLGPSFISLQPCKAVPPGHSTLWEVSADKVTPAVAGLVKCCSHYNALGSDLNATSLTQ
jgi:hypothetical protein